MSPYPTVRGWVGILLLCISVVCLSLSINHGHHELKSSVNGTLNEKYVDETETDHGVTTHRYECTYNFSVNGTDYHGTDTVDKEPEIADCTVYFDANNPNINGLTSAPMSVRQPPLAA